MQVSGQRHTPAVLPTGKNPGADRLGGCLVHKPALDVLEKRKTFSP
jgi:hypothetical protein